MPGPVAQTHGPIHKVPCPHCGKPNDFRELLTQGDSTIFPNTEVFCDHCGFMMIVKNVQKITVLYVVPGATRDPQWQQGGKQPLQRQVQPTMMQRLLGRGGKR